MRRDFIKTGIAVVAGLYFLWCAVDLRQWHLIDGVNLIIHFVAAVSGVACAFTLG